MESNGLDLKSENRRLVLILDSSKPLVMTSLIVSNPGASCIGKLASRPHLVARPDAASKVAEPSARN